MEEYEGQYWLLPNHEIRPFTVLVSVSPHPQFRQRIPHGLLRKLVEPLVSQEPASRLIRQTALQQWRLLALNLGSSLLEAFTEGATLAVVFLAVEALSGQTAQQFNWGSNPVVSRIPGAVGVLSSMPAGAAFSLLLGVAVLLQALHSLAQFGQKLSVGYFAARCTSRVKTLIHQQVLSFSYPCASAYKVGDLTNYATTGPRAVETQIKITSALLVSFLLISTYLGVLMRISPWLLLGVGLIGVMITALQRYLQPRIRQGSHERNLLEVEISQRVTEEFQALRLLHSSGQLDAADQQLRRRMRELEQIIRRQTFRLSLVGPIASFLLILAIALITSLSLWLFGGRSSGVLPSLVTFVLALQRLNARLSEVAAKFNNLADNTAKIARLNEILTPAGKQFRKLGGLSFVALEQEIRFDRVFLEYSPECPPALRDISFSLPKGQLVALVGPSGAGKSSIADLLTALYSPTSGQILIDGKPLNRFDLASWQQRLGVVSQDTFLFNATIAENIAFGTPGASQADIEASCQAAQATGFIENLPDSYETLVGERGYRLSGGQRQRLSLARAILRDPELLILDEATSALDSQSERLVQEAIEKFERNHTVLVIAHRLSTIVNADQILVLDSGLIVQRGTHKHLLAQEGLYQKLWMQQSLALRSQ